jgi:membrane protein DedA with SNARE-associated domain
VLACARQRFSGYPYGMGGVVFRRVDRGWHPWRRVRELPSVEGMLSGIVDFVTGLVERLGGPGAGIAVALENLFPPIPSEVILPLAGFVASQGRMSLIGAILWTTAGSVAGAVALYYVGVLMGRDRVRALAAKLPLVKVADVDRTEAWFLKHGVKAVFFGRFIPVFRSLVSIPAGLERMRMGTFLLYTALGSLIWNTIFIMLGYALGANWARIEGWVGTYQNGVIAICAAVAAWFVISRIRRSRRPSPETAAVNQAIPGQDIGAEQGIGAGQKVLAGRKVIAGENGGEAERPRPRTAGTVYGTRRDG